MGAPVRRPNLAQKETLLKALSDRDYLQDVTTICRKHHVTVDELLSGSREKHVTKARLACILKMREDGLSWTSIAALLNIDHSSALSAVKRAVARGHVGGA
jgi:chromosomal replication initiation ATPase DnaA